MYNSTNPPNIFVIYSHDGTDQKIGGQTIHVAPHTVIAANVLNQSLQFLYTRYHFIFIL